MSNTETDQALREAAAVELVSPGLYRAQLSSGYTVLGHPNGGYLQCVMANAATAATLNEGATHQHVTSLTTNFVRSPETGPSDLTTEVRRVGRGASFVHVTLRQDDEVTTESLVTLGTLVEDAAVRYHGTTPPEVAPLEECLRIPANPLITYTNVLDARLDPSCVGWWTGEPSELAELKGWLRLNDGEADWSAWSVLFATDALPPATMPIGSSGWVPTLQLTSYVRRIPQSEWLRARQWCVVIANGLVDERCELFDDRGELVASSSQLAMVRFPSPQ